MAAADLVAVGVAQVAFGAAIVEPLFFGMGAVALVLAALAWRVRAAWGVVPGIIGGALMIVQYAIFPQQFRFFDSALDFVPAFTSVAGSAGAVAFGVAHVQRKRVRCDDPPPAFVVRGYATAFVSLLAVAVASGVVDVLDEPATVSAAERDSAVVVRYKDFETDNTRIEATAGEPIRIVVDNQDRVFHDFNVKGTDVKVGLGPKDEKLIAFTLDAGAYTYVCTLHTEMKGELIVK
jgi:plastocyanin